MNLRALARSGIATFAWLVVAGVAFLYFRSASFWWLGGGIVIIAGAILITHNKDLIIPLTRDEATAELAKAEKSYDALVSTNRWIATVGLAAIGTAFVALALSLRGAPIELPFALGVYGVFALLTFIGLWAMKADARRRCVFLKARIEKPGVQVNSP